MGDKLKIPQIKPDKASQLKEEKVEKTMDSSVEESVMLDKNVEENSDTTSSKTLITPIDNTKEDGIQKPQLTRNKKIVLLSALVVLLILVLGIIVPGFFVYVQAKATMKSANNLKAAVATKNINNVKSAVVDLKKNINKTKTPYKFLGWTRIIPFVGGYWNDGNAALNGAVYELEAGEVLIDTIGPYADLLGFSGDATPKTAEQNAEGRIQFIVETIGGIIPKLPAISDKLNLAEKEFAKIDPNRYPEKFKGKEVRAKLVEGLNLASDAAKIGTDAKPILEQAPYLLGIDAERTFLLLFQNDKELRPTGGFITAYSVMKVNKGKISQVTSNDIYNLDTKYKPTIPAPEPIVKYIKGPYILSQNLRIRDMNFDPDFKVSMDQFLNESQKVGIPPVDGIIAVDTQVLVKLLAVIGEVGVSGFGNYSDKIDSRCNCPQVIYELESFADVEGPIIWDPVTGKIILRPPHSDNRKAIVGPLMNSVLSNSLGQPKEKIPALFKAGYDSLIEKHILFYLNDENAQKAVESFNVAGRIEDYDGDYLHINDSNLGGRKSNLYVTQEVEQTVNIAKDGTVEKIVNITYKNPEKQDGWLNSVLPNWVRVYVPKGSQLVSMEGVTDKKDPYEEYGKTVFAGYFELRPQGVAKVTLKYRTPVKAKGTYKLLVQKQPGTDMPLYTVKLGKKSEEAFLKTDHEYKIKL